MGLILHFLSCSINLTISSDFNDFTYEIFAQKVLFCYLFLNFPGHFHTFIIADDP